MPITPSTFTPSPITTLANVTVPYQRLLDSTEASVDESGVTASATFNVLSAEDAWQFVRDCAGTIQNLGTPDTPLYYKIPLQYPENHDLFASTARIEYRRARQFPATGAGAWNYSGPSGLGPNPYGGAKVTIGFKFYAWNFQDAQWSSRQLRQSANFVTLPYRVYSFADGTQTGADMGFLVPEQDLLYTRYWIPDLSYIEPTIYSMVGRVNSEPFGPNNLDPGTVLFLGGDTDQSRSVFGQLSQNVQMAFRWRYIPWNYFMHPNGTSGFQPVYDGAGNQPYPAIDLNALLTV